MKERLLPRPYASNGAWLSVLLPVALAISYLHSHTTTPACNTSAVVHRYQIVIALGACLRTLGFLLSSNVSTSPVINWMINVLPGFITSLCLGLQPETNWTLSFFAGFLITTIYQHVYVSVMRGLPKTFSYGEAAILVQGLVLFLLNATSRIYALFALQATPVTDFGQVNAIMQSALLCLVLVCVLLALVPILRKPLPFYLLMGLLLVAVTCAPVTQPLPLIALLNFILRDQKRLYVIVFYLLLVVLTGATVSWQLGNSTQANTRVRKIFHLLIVLVFVPGLVYQCALLYIATGIAFAIFVVLELLRLLQVPPFAATLLAAFDSFKDVKDAGQLALTPFCLLIGCSLPIWLTCCPCGQSSQLNPNPSLLMLLSGVLAVGVGDTAASVVGSQYGRNKWSNSTRSLEGTLAFVVSILLSVWTLELVGILDMDQGKWFATVFAALNSALVEAFTDQVDNLVLPLVFYTLVGLA